MTKTIEETIEQAKEIIARHDYLTFATIWKTGKYYGFNFKQHEVGYSYKEYGIKRTVVHVLKKQD